MRPVDETMDLVLQIRHMLDARGMSIRWPSSERLTSSSLRKSTRKGAGLQYFGQKVYDPADGDDPRRIDYNASAAEPEDEMGDQQMIVQTFKSPRIVRVNVLLDVNKSMNMGTKGTLKSILGAVCAGSGIKSAQKFNDQASFVTYTHKPVTVLKGQNAGRLLVAALVHSVEDCDVEDTSVGTWAEQLLRHPDRQISAEASQAGGLALALQVVPSKMRSVVLVVTDFANMSDDDWEALRISGIRNDTIVVFVQDRRERELPKAPWPGMHYTLEDFRGESKSFWVAPDNSPRWYLNQMRRLFGSVTTREEFAENWKRHEARILERLQECGVNTLIVSTDESDQAVQDLLAMLANKLRS
jgi:uncharacterized protein (DUF58 family)